jgi:hypothetical protein
VSPLSSRDVNCPNASQTNAYVSGMKEDLALYGNQLNFFTTYFKWVLTAFLSRTQLLRSYSIGYMIMLYPSCIIISHIGPSVWLPAMEVSLELFLALHLGWLVNNVARFRGGS